MTPTEIRQNRERKRPRLPPLDESALKRMESLYKQGVAIKSIAGMFRVGRSEVSKMMKHVKWGCERE